MRGFKSICLLLVMIMCACGNANSSASKNSDSKIVDAVTKDDAVEQKEVGTTFYDITLEEAFKKAEAEGKYVLICFSIKTCAPCKKMKKVVFPTPKCGEYVNKHFVTIAMDGEDEGIGQEFAAKYNVFIYPTYLVLQPNGFREGMIQGAEFDIDSFLDMLKTIIHDKQ